MAIRQGQNAVMRRLLLGAAVLAALVTVLAVLVAHSVPALLDVDAAAGAALRFDGGGSTGVDVLQVLTAPGLSVFRLVILLPLAVWYAVRREFRVTGFILVAAVVVGPLTTLLKELVGRVRPTADDPLVAADGLSFPSGHSSGAATLAGILLVLLWSVVNHRWRVWLAGALVLAATCVAWTRIALGVHYLSDVLGGLSLGAAVVLASMAVFGIYPGGPAERSASGRVDAAARSD